MTETRAYVEPVPWDASGRDRGRYYFVVLVDYGEVPALAIRCDLIDASANFQNLAEAMDDVYWDGARKSHQDVVGRFLDVDATSRLTHNSELGNFYVDKSVAGFRLEDAIDAARSK